MTLHDGDKARRSQIRKDVTIVFADRAHKESHLQKKGIHAIQRLTEIISGCK